MEALPRPTSQIDLDVEVEKQFGVMDRVENEELVNPEFCAFAMDLLHDVAMSFGYGCFYKSVASHFLFCNEQ